MLVNLSAEALAAGGGSRRAAPALVMVDRSVAVHNAVYQLVRNLDTVGYLCRDDLLAADPCHFYQCRAAVFRDTELRSYFLHKWVMGDKRNGMAVESIRQDFQYAFTPVGYRKMQYFTLRKDCFDTLFCCLVGFTGT